MSVSLESLMRPLERTERGLPLALELMSFLLIGGIAALLFVALSAAMIGLYPAVPAWMMSAGCYAAFILPVYLMHRRFTFRSGEEHRRALPRYVAVQVSALVLASAFSFLCYSMLGLSGWSAALIVIALTSGVNFMALRFWAFASGRR